MVAKGANPYLLHMEEYSTNNYSETMRRLFESIDSTPQFVNDMVERMEKYDIHRHPNSHMSPISPKSEMRHLILSDAHLRQYFLKK